MWIFTNKGFISVVQNRNNANEFQVRARSKKHLQTLFKGREILTLTPADYKYRVNISKKDFRAFADDYINNLKYDDFKSSIKDNEYHDLCLDVWDRCRSFQNGKYKETRSARFFGS